MNIAIGSKTFGRNSRIGLGVLVAGLSVAAIVTGAGIWQATDSGSPATVAEPASAPAAVRPIEPATRAPTPVHYYLIDSQVQADALAQAAFEAQMNYGGLGTEFNDSTRVIDVRTPEGQAALQSLEAGITEDKLNGGVGAEIVDLRTGSLTASVSTAYDRNFASNRPQSTIYIVGSEAERLQLLQEVDEAAAFEGGDYLVPNILVVDPSDPEALQLEEAITEDKLHGGVGANLVDLR